MRFGRTLRRYWPETLLVLAVALPWLSLLVLGIVWLWQGGHVWAWAIAAAVLGLLAWPLARLVRRRANAEARVALGDIAEPSRGWNVVERDAWAEVLAIADATAPFSFTEFDPLFAGARETVEAVARRLPSRGRAAPGRSSACPRSCCWPSACVATCAGRRSATSRDKDAAAQSPAVGAAAKRALRRGRADRMARGLRPLAARARRAQSAAGRRPGNQRRVRGEDRERPLLSPARLRDADVRARGRPRRHRPVLRPAGAVGGGGARRARARRGRRRAAGRAGADRADRPGQRGKVEPGECIGAGDAVRGRTGADHRARGRIPARAGRAAGRVARRPCRASASARRRRRSCWRRPSAPTSSCGSPPRRSRRARRTGRSLDDFRAWANAQLARRAAARSFWR